MRPFPVLYAQDVAVKVFSPAHLSRGQEEEFRREAGIMESLRHPNVVLYMGAIESPLRRCIVSEFMPRSASALSCPV